MRLPGDVLDAVERLVERPGWHRDAACRGMGPALFFPVGKGPHVLPAVAAAQAICAGCQVVAECRASGATEAHGVWAGESGNARRRRRAA